MWFYLHLRQVCSIINFQEALIEIIAWNSTTNPAAEPYCAIRERQFAKLSSTHVPRHFSYYSTWMNLVCKKLFWFALCHLVKWIGVTFCWESFLYFSNSLIKFLHQTYLKLEPSDWILLVLWKASSKEDNCAW